MGERKKYTRREFIEKAAIITAGISVLPFVGIGCGPIHAKRYLTPSYATFKPEDGIANPALETEEAKALAAEIRVAVLNRINYHRKFHNVQAVETDKLAQFIGDLHCRDMLNRRALSHWGSDGMLSYHRYSGHFGNDAIAENAACTAYVSSAISNLRIWIKSALKLHDLMYNEKPPDDGHRKNILQPEHTHVGIGVAFDNRSFYMTQEFINRYVEIDFIDKPLHGGKEIKLNGRMINEGVIDHITVHWEPFPKHMDAEDMRKSHSYSFPEDKNYHYLKLPEGWHYKDRTVGIIKTSDDKRLFQASIPLDYGSGLYTIAVWVDTLSFGMVRATNICIEAR